MPCTCDNWDFDGCDYGQSPSHYCTAPDSPDHIKNHQPRGRFTDNAHLTDIDKDSSASLIKNHTSDKGSTPARILSHISKSEFESSCKKQDCRSVSHKKVMSSNSPQSHLTHDSEQCCKGKSATTHNIFLTQSEQHVVSSLCDSDSNAPIGITTKTITIDNTANDQGRSSSGIEEKYNKEQQDILRKEKLNSLRSNSPISISNLSVDLPKLAVSPGVKRASPSLHSTNHTHNNDMHHFHHDAKQSHIENNERFHKVSNDMRGDLHFSFDNLDSKMMSQTTSSPVSSRLYSLLHSATSLEPGFDNLRHRSNYYTNPFDLSPLPSNASTSSFGTPRSLHKTWMSSDIMMKSSPELRSYFSHHTSPHILIDNKIRSQSGSDAINNYIPSPNNRNSSMNAFGNSCVSIKAENVILKSSAPPHHTTNTSAYVSSISKCDEPLSPGSSNNNDSSVTASSAPSPSLLRIKQENAVSHGLFRHRMSSFSPSPRAASPYNSLSSSLSPWSDGDSDFNQLSTNTLGVPMKNRSKCASDSSLYLPRTVQPSLSPSLSSSASASHESMLVECRWKSCSQTFTCQKSLAQHVNDYHVRIERPDIDFQCHWQGCSRQGKGFNARYKMLIHIRTHTNEKPHKCAVCRKCFSRLENLKIHMRSHTGEKPYACTFPGCTKAYSNSSDRFKHVRTHQEEKPYKCKMPGCHKQYTDPSSLRKHVRTHNHGTKCNQSSLRHAAGGDNGIEQSANDKGSSNKDDLSPLSQACSEQRMDIHDDFDKGLEMDPNNHRNQGLEGVRSLNDMSDIQQNIELYSSLEMKSGIQKFGQIEDYVREDFHPTVFTSGSATPNQKIVSEEIIRMGDTPSNPTSNYNDAHQVSSNSRHLCLSLPSIIIEEINEFSKSAFNGKRDVNSVTSSRENNVVGHSLGLKRRISDDNEEEQKKKTVDSGEDLGTNVKIVKEGNLEQDIVKSSTAFNSISLSHYKAASPPAPSSSSPPKHWKKRKIFDDQKQQEEEKEKRAKEIQQEQEEESKAKDKQHEQHQSLQVLEEAAKRREASLFVPDSSADKAIDMTSFSRVSSPPQNNNNHITSHFSQRQSLLPSCHRTTSNDTSPSISVIPCQVLESKAPSNSSMLSCLTTSPLISSDSLHNPLPPNHIPHSPLSLSPLPPHSLSLPYRPTSPNQLRHLPLPISHSRPFLTPPALYINPELHYPSSKHERSSISPLSPLTTTAAAASMLFPKSQKSYRDIYFSHLSTLMDLSLASSRLDSISHHPLPHHLHPLSTLALSPPHHHHSIVNPVTNLPCPVGLSVSPVSRTLL